MNSIYGPFILFKFYLSQISITMNYGLAFISFFLYLIYKTMYLNSLFLIFLLLSCFVLCWMAKALEGLIVKLNAQFPKQVIMDAMGIVYP